MNAVIRRILEAVRDRKVTRGTEALARGVLEAEDRRDVLAAAKACTTAKVAKQAVASVEHHEAFREEQEFEADQTAEDVWLEVQQRTRIDHRGRLACEACHKERGVEPHHLILVSRTNAPYLVMALCRSCHTGEKESAHGSPRWFAQKIVIPWAKDHGYPLPNRKEYRDA